MCWDHVSTLNGGVRDHKLPDQPNNEMKYYLEPRKLSFDSLNFFFGPETVSDRPSSKNKALPVFSVEQIKTF